MQIFQIILFDRIQDAASLGNPFSGEREREKKKKKGKKKEKRTDPHTLHVCITLYY